jgi:Arc/MetJ-type ribon-helix-helix transcriptional regulator
MNISLTPETEKLLEEQMKKGHFASPDDAVRTALQTLDQVRGEDYENLDEQTRAAIEEAEAQHQRGEGRAWGEVREELRARFIKNCAI